MSRFCREKGDPLGSGDVIWPGDRWLSGFAADIRALALMHNRGGKTIWTCIKAIDCRYPTLKLGKNIENMVNRAAKLCQEPAAITIQQQATAGSRAAQECFGALKLCREGECEISSVNWNKYGEMLSPARGQSCQAKATQILIEWLRWNVGVRRDVNPLKYWIARIGNLDLASRLMPRESASVYDRIREEREKTRSRKKAAVRQAIFRLRRGLSKLEDDFRSFATLLRSTRYQLVQEELQTIDSVESTDRERDAGCNAFDTLHRAEAGRLAKIFRQDCVTSVALRHDALLKRLERIRHDCVTPVFPHTICIAELCVLSHL